MLRRPALKLRGRPGAVDTRPTGPFAAPNPANRNPYRLPAGAAPALPNAKQGGPDFQFAKLAGPGPLVLPGQPAWTAA